MGKEILTYDDLLQIVELIKSAESFSEFHLKIGDIELDLRKADAGASAPSAAAASTPKPVAATTVSTEPAPAAADQVPAAAARAPVDVPAGSVVIKSPMVGTFYRSPEPDIEIPNVRVKLVVNKPTLCSPTERQTSATDRSVARSSDAARSSVRVNR